MKLIKILFPVLCLSCRSNAQNGTTDRNGHLTIYNGGSVVWNQAQTGTVDTSFANLAVGTYYGAFNYPYATGSSIPGTIQIWDVNGHPVVPAPGNPPPATTGSIAGPTEPSTYSGKFEFTITVTAPTPTLTPTPTPTPIPTPPLTFGPFCPPPPPPPA